MAPMSTAEQRLRAIEAGNLVRLAHATERKALRSASAAEGRRAAAAILREPGELDRMRVRYLLESINGFGAARIGKLIRRAALAPGRLDRRLVELTERERRLIADHLTDPDRPAAGQPELTADELALIRQLCTAVARRTTHERERARLEEIARKCEAVAWAIG